MRRKPIEELKNNLNTVARVYEWAKLMGYDNERLFSRHFLRHFGRRPEKVRLRSIIKQLRMDGRSCLEVARAHSLPDEKALNSYTNRHLGVSPSQVKELSDKELQKRMKNSGSETGE